MYVNILFGCFILSSENILIAWHLIKKKWPNCARFDTSVESGTHFDGVLYEFYGCCQASEIM